MKTPFTPLHERLRGPIRTALQKELGIANVHALPYVKHVIVNVGLNQRRYNSKEMQEYIAKTVASITGQKPVFRKARKSISNFNIREGLIVGMMVTLRGKAMENFIDRLVGYALPRVRDFRGLSTKLDGHGNYSIGVRDQSIFPEIAAPEANKIFGMQIQISTTAKNDAEALALLKQIGFPFKRERTS
jgi:large subunit ribosomal protein L5